MGTITISTSTTPFTGSKTYNISDADMTNLLNWAISYFATGGPPLTNAQAAVAWTQWVINQTVQFEHGFRSGNAANNAVAGTPPMSIT
jgi:hypothetical protein